MKIGKFLLSSALVAIPTLVHAQTVDDQPQVGTGIQDIVVTAQRRTESVQRASLTIDVIGGEEAASKGLSDVTDINRLTTGVQIGNGGNNSQIFIRGVGDFSYNATSSPGVAFNVDGVYVGRPDGVNGNFYDLARVEVLKGPQGTLYGRNANGGAINVITNAPMIGETSGYVSGQIGNYELRQIAGALNLGVGANLALRGAFNIIDRDGYFSDGTGDDVQQSGRLRLKWEPTPDIAILLNGDYSHLGGKGGGYSYLKRRPGADPWEGVTEPVANAYRASVLPFGPLLDPLTNDGVQDTTLWNVSAQIDWDLGPATLTVLPAYRKADIFSIANPGFNLTTDSDVDQKSLEVRLGNSSPELSWTIGGFYYDEKIRSYSDIAFDTSTLQNVRVNSDARNKAPAAFGQVTVQLVDGLRAIGGIRYTKETRRYRGASTDFRSGSPVLAATYGGQKNFEAITWKAGAEFDVSEQNMLYATYSTGYKAGGFNPTVAPRDIYRPEKLRALEIGSRNRFWGNRLQVNASLFHWKYRDIHDPRVAIDPLGQSNFLFSNSGDATLKGATLDIVAKPTAADTVTFSTEYTHSRYDRFNIDIPTPFFNPASVGCTVAENDLTTTPFPTTRISCKGYQVARVPEWSGSASYEHVFTLADDATVRVGGDMQFASARWLSSDFAPVERAKAYATFNASVDYVASGERYSIGAFIRNIGDTAVYTGGILSSFAPPIFTANLAPPRVYGIRAKFSFGQ